MLNSGDEIIVYGQKVKIESIENDRIILEHSIVVPGVEYTRDSIDIKELEKLLCAFNIIIMKFSFRIEDLELRSCGEHLLVEGVEHNRAEIIKWVKDTGEKEYCWTIAYWNKHKEGYDLEFVGNRPFDVNSDLFMKLGKLGQKLLDDAFNCA